VSRTPQRYYRTSCRQQNRLPRTPIDHLVPRAWAQHARIATKGGCRTKRSETARAPCRQTRQHGAPQPPYRRETRSDCACSCGMRCHSPCLPAHSAPRPACNHLSRSTPGLERSSCFRSRFSPGVTKFPSQTKAALSLRAAKATIRSKNTSTLPHPRRAAPGQPAQPRRAAPGRPAARSARALTATTPTMGVRARRAAAAAWRAGRAAARSARASGPPPPGARRGPCRRA
jgi:hypothetical protein